MTTRIFSSAEIKDLKVPALARKYKCSDDYVRRVLKGDREHNIVMASLQQIISWFKEGLFPSEDQFRQTWLSYWHKSEKIPQSQVFGLENSLNNVSVGMIYKPPVANVSDLTTTYPNAKTGWSVKVESNGYIYQYDGSVWNNTGLTAYPGNVATQDELEQVKSYVLPQVQSIGFITGSFINMNTGVLVTGSNWSCSDYIDISSVISINCCMFVYGGAGLAFYDEYNAFIAGFGNSAVSTPTETLLQIEIPQIAKYVRFSNWTANNNSFNVAFNSISSNIKIQIGKVPSIENTLNGIAEDVNLLVSANESGGYRKTDGSLAATSTLSDFRYTNKIPITAKDVILYTGSIFSETLTGVVYFDVNNNYIGYQFDSTANAIKSYTNEPLVIPANAAFAAFTGYTEGNRIFTVSKKSIVGLTEKADHGYSSNETIRTVKDVENDYLSLFTSGANNLYYSTNVLTDETRYLSASGNYAVTNGNYGVVTKIPVIEGKTYCIQGLGAIIAIRIAGRTDRDTNTGLIIPNISGSDYDGWATITIPTGQNITNIAFIYLFPTKDRQFQVKEASAPSAVEKKTIKPELLPSVGGNTQQIFYLDVVNGNDNNSGNGKSTALKTVAKFVSLAKNNPKNILFVAGGVYSEQLNISGMIGELSIIGYEGETIIFKGSNELTGWTAVSGYTGIYSCGFTGSIPVHGSYNKGRGIIYETGRSSIIISENERHSAQKGLSNRLPFTLVQQSLATTLDTALADINSNGGWYIDNGVLYLKNSDGSNPTTNGYVYEYQAKSAFNCSSALAKLFIANISFRYTASIVFNCNFVERYNCSILGCNGDGFKDNVTKLRTYFDECAVCGNDGANGHYSGRSNWTALDLRASGNMAEYHFAWMHDNGDDGLSHHEASHLFVFGGLYEYNGDGGIRPSTTCTGEFHNVYARRNGQDVGGSGVSGSGFDIVNSPLTGDTRKGNNIILYNCVSENNMRGFASISNANGRITLVNCLAKDNSIADYFSSGGTLIAKNCKVSNTDSSKKKVTSGAGVIEVESYEELS